MSNRISEIQITPIKPIDGLVGFASLVFDGCLYLGSIGVFTRPNGGFRLTYPTRKGTMGGANVFHPINRIVAEQIEHAVIEKFEKLMSK